MENKKAMLDELLETVGGGVNGLTKELAEKLPLANNEKELADVLASAGIRLDEEKLAKVKKLFERPGAVDGANVKGLADDLLGKIGGGLAFEKVLPKEAMAELASVKDAEGVKSILAKFGKDLNPSDLEELKKKLEQFGGHKL